MSILASIGRRGTKLSSVVTASYFFMRSARVSLFAFPLENVFVLINQNDVIVIDGLSGLITINGVAADMSKNDFISFPVLTPGENTVVCDTVAEIEYYPIYL